MSKQNDRPVALVTGSRKGIGRQLCSHLLGKGYVVVGFSRGPADWEAEDFTHFEADVAVEKDVRSVMRYITKDFGRLDVLVNNAGVASMNHFLLTPLETASSIINTNLLGVFLVSREAAKLMRRRKFGRIVSFGSAAVPLRLPGEAVYLAAKNAVVTFSQVLAHELAMFGITVNVVGPSPTQTDMIRGVPEEKINALLDALPIKRLTTFEDIFNVVDFFLSPASSAITGQVVYLGGAHNS